uniref:Uncharacterized protein n=1 Tax=Rhizophora mucronata TaxID=61149 RepID=A0A2P2QWD4_RHIMU
MSLGHLVNGALFWHILGSSFCILFAFLFGFSACVPCTMLIPFPAKPHIYINLGQAIEY